MIRAWLTIQRSAEGVGDGRQENVFVLLLEGMLIDLFLGADIDEYDNDKLFTHDHLSGRDQEGVLMITEHFGFINADLRLRLIL
jgi:hypothetical protein